ncbi:hypothetical protein V6N13_010485 [Hibiscus sabdariffa]
MHKTSCSKFRLSPIKLFFVFPIAVKNPIDSISYVKYLTQSLGCGSACTMLVSVFHYATSGAAIWIQQGFDSCLP